MPLTLKLLKSQIDYQEALDQMKTIMITPDEEIDKDYAESLAVLIEQYEDKHYPIPEPDPIEAIKFRMDQMWFTLTDLANVIGQKSRASEILNRKRRLTLPMIRKISAVLKISPSILVQEYSLAG